MKTLKDLKVGQRSRVVKLHGEGAVKRRIMDMGITKGTEIYVRKLAPLGDPMELIIHGYSLTLRLADAEKIAVTELNEAKKSENSPTKQKHKKYLQFK